jgi:phosphoglycolate phosphatase
MIRLKMRRMNRRLVLLDIDGTMVDSREVILEGQRRAFAALNLPAPSDAAILATVGLSLEETFLALVGPSGPRDALSEHYRTHVRDLRADPSWGEPLYPGVDQTLRALSRRDDIVLGIATGRARRGIEPLLQLHGWHGLFKTIQCGDEHPSKPDPAMLRAALADMGITAEDTLFVGDSTFDAEMSKAAGIPFVAVTWGFEAIAVLKAIGAAAVLHRFEDLPELLAA